MSSKSNLQSSERLRTLVQQVLPKLMNKVEGMEARIEQIHKQISALNRSRFVHLELLINKGIALPEDIIEATSAYFRIASAIVEFKKKYPDLADKNPTEAVRILIDDYSTPPHHAGIAEECIDKALRELYAGKSCSSRVIYCVQRMGYTVDAQGMIVFTEIPAPEPQPEIKENTVNDNCNSENNPQDTTGSAGDIVGESGR